MAVPCLVTLVAPCVSSFSALPLHFPGTYHVCVRFFADRLWVQGRSATFSTIQLATLNGAFLTQGHIPSIGEEASHNTSKEQNFHILGGSGMAS